MNVSHTGFEAMRILMETIADSNTPPKTILDLPTHITERYSVNRKTSDDELVSKALQSIRQNFLLFIQVTDGAKFVGVSRRSLERAKQLLVHTSDSVNQIALASGFDYVVPLFLPKYGTMRLVFSQKSKLMTQSHNPNRREALKKILTGGAALATGGALVSREEKILAAHLAEENKNHGVQDVEVDALSGASRTHTNWAKFADLKKPMAKATIKGIDFSRMVMGGNLINGWAHARDLIYVSDLVKAYHTRDKIFATFKMGEACGISAYVGNASNMELMNDYWDKAEGTLRFIVQSKSLDEALFSLDGGASAAMIQGEANDRLVREGKFDEIANFVDRLRKEKAISGLGAHHLETIKACVEKGIEPDFWMKTIHHGQYWSRMQDKSEHDNVYCREPDETKEFMASLKQPWIGFKVLAAGAIRPHEGFRFAFESGADFLCVGMYDFQIVDDVNICMDILESGINRKRPWCYT